MDYNQDMTPSLSVVIPTHNRAKILARCLEYLERQTIAEKLEVIVVNDDSGKLKVESGKFDLSILDVPPCHQGVARNKGVEKARSGHVLFIGDDIFLSPDACARHLAAARNRRAVLGFTTWDPACGITPVMEWLEQSGWQFGYPMIEEYTRKAIPPSMQHRFTYTSHVSLPTAVAKQIPFRDDMTLYGWEDIEWGLRLKNAGVELFYEPDARALHHHHMTMEDSLKRMETLGTSAVQMEQMVPSLTLVPRGLKRWKYRAASLLPTMRGRHAKAFLRGMATHEKVL